MILNNKIVSPWLDYLPYNWNIFNSKKTTLHFLKNNYVFLEGDRLNNVYIVIEGRIRTFMNSIDGKEKTIMVIGENGLLGENFIQGQSTYSTSAIAVTDSTLLKVDKKIFSKVAFSDKKIMAQWLKMLSLKAEVLTHAYSNLSFNKTKTRLARSLFYLATTYGKKTKNTIRIDIKFTHQELADFIGSSRVTISKEISEFQKEGIISISDGYYHIQNTSKLLNVYNTNE